MEGILTIHDNVLDMHVLSSNIHHRKRKSAVVLQWDHSMTITKYIHQNTVTNNDMIPAKQRVL